MGVSEPKEPTCSAGMVAGISGVQMGPGATVLTRMPFGASSCDSPVVQLTSAPLVEA
jgi:hypothetical protein